MRKLCSMVIKAVLQLQVSRRSLEVTKLWPWQLQRRRRVTSNDVSIAQYSFRHVLKTAGNRIDRDSWRRSLAQNAKLHAAKRDSVIVSRNPYWQMRHFWAIVSMEPYCRLCIHIPHYPHPSPDPNPNPKSYPNLKFSSYQYPQPNMPANWMTSRLRDQSAARCKNCLLVPIGCTDNTWICQYAPYWQQHLRAKSSI